MPKKSLSDSTSTPMMNQFAQFKSENPDAVLLFRCGDFYESYLEDAEVISKVLGITLTKRNNGNSTREIPMCGFPYHAVDNYLPKLVRHGLRVAICDQLEDPKLTNTLVKRGVTEVVTPGVNYTTSTQDGRENTFCCCIVRGKATIGIAFIDITMGDFLVGEGDEGYVDKLLHNFSPKEVLYSAVDREWYDKTFGSEFYTYQLSDWMVSDASTSSRLLKQFSVKSLKGFGVEDMQLGICAAGGLLHYLDSTKHPALAHIYTIRRLDESDYVSMDKFTMRNLELTLPADGNTKDVSSNRTLYGVLDKTTSPMGARLLHRWIVFPLKEVRPILNRQEVVKYFVERHEECCKVQKVIGSIQDLDRLCARLTTRRILPRELIQLGTSLTYLDEVRTLCTPAEAPKYLHTLIENLPVCDDVATLIGSAISIDTPATLGKLGVINEGYSSELEALRSLRKNHSSALHEMEQREIYRTGIPSLHIANNGNFGYFFEVRNNYKKYVPPDWTRKQTLKDAERYTTPELTTYEEKIMSAESDMLTLESTLYNDLLTKCCEHIEQFKRAASIIAQIDCLCAFAQVAEEYNYCCPEINEELSIEIHDGRHPMIERNLKVDEQYVPNDMFLENNGQQIVMLTGPNMSGKSAYLRQNMLIVLLAQIGSFVPASRATIGVVDKLFSRVGASDNISLGESTFMVEMTESASILNNITERSFVIFDEIGRGTATYDGISIAWAIVEFLHNHPAHCKTLFATHYHELNEMSETFERVKNYNVSIKEQGDKILFLRKIIPGCAEHSFGIHVAKLAGMPMSVVQTATKILHQLETEAVRDINGKVKVKKPEAGTQLSIFKLDDPVLESIRDTLRDIDVDTMTPIEALNKLHEIKSIMNN